MAGAEGVRPPFRQRFGARLRASVPAPAVTLFGSVLWGAALGLSAALDLYLRNGLATLSPVALLSLYFYGAAVAFAPGLFLAELVASGRGAVARFILGFIFIVLSTHTATAAIFALQYRAFYAHWHADFPSLIWFFQLAFTSVSAVYQFTVESIYVYLPMALAAAIGFSLWFVRRAH